MFPRVIANLLRMKVNVEKYKVRASHTTYLSQTDPGHACEHQPKAVRTVRPLFLTQAGTCPGTPCICIFFEHRVLPKTTAAATGRDLPMVDSRGKERHDPSIIYTCYYHNFRASALAVWHLTLTSTYMYRTAYAVMVWRSMPHAPDALSTAGTARAQHRPHVLTAPVLCGHKISRGCWSA